MYHVYILKSRVADRYYVGHSGNLQQRIYWHNQGMVRSTKAYKPWDVIYTEEKITKAEASKREAQIKLYKRGEAFKKLIGI